MYKRIGLNRNGQKRTKRTVMNCNEPEYEPKTCNDCNALYTDKCTLN